MARYVIKYSSQFRKKLTGSHSDLFWGGHNYLTASL